MSITFDQVDGVIQRAADAPAEAAPATEAAPAPDHHQLVRELARLERRRDRLRTD
jgi:hypothetical protein